MVQRDGVRALVCALRVDALAQRAQLPHALDGVVDLVRLHVLQLVDVEALGLVSFCEKNEGHSAVLGTGWIQLGGAGYQG